MRVEAEEVKGFLCGSECDRELYGRSNEMMFGDGWFELAVYDRFCF